MDDKTDKDPCPVCEENARRRAEAVRAPVALDFVYCPVCDGGAKCRVTGCECGGRVAHSMRRDGSGSLVEVIGFPCQEPVARVVQYMQKVPAPASRLPEEK